MTLRVLFLVNSLCVGGAEKHVVSLVNGLDPARHRLALTALKREEALLHALIAKVGGSSAELAASGEHIPEELSKSDYRILHLHASTGRAKVKLNRLKRQLL